MTATWAQAVRFRSRPSHFGFPRLVLPECQLPAQVMKLTSVRVRGKRKLPPSSTTSSAPRPSKMQRSIEDIMHMRLLEPRVTLETLPGEILENIFLYSGNISLPRASPIIGAKLSARVTLLRFFIWAFHDTWDQWFGIPAMIDVHGPRTEEETEKFPDRHGPNTSWPCDGDPELQSALLELPWVDMDFILQAQQSWADTYARSRWFQHLCLGSSKALMTQIQKGTGYGVFRAREFFDLEYRLECIGAIDPGISAYRAILVSARDVHPDVRLPQSLLTGPWNEEQRQRLFWLVRGGIDMQNPRGPTRRMPWEYHCEFLRNSAIRAETPDVMAHRCLLHPWTLDCIPIDTIRRERDDLVKRMQWGSDDAEAELGVLRRTLAALNYQLDYSMFHK